MFSASRSLQIVFWKEVRAADVCVTASVMQGWIDRFTYFNNKAQAVGRVARRRKSVASCLVARSAVYIRASLEDAECCCSATSGSGSDFGRGLV